MAPEDHRPIVVVRHDLFHDESDLRVQHLHAVVLLVLIEEGAVSRDVLDRVGLPQDALRRQHRRTGRHLQRRLAVAAEGQRRPVGVQRIVGGVVRVSLRVVVQLIRRRSHRAGHPDHARDADPKLHLDRGNVQRVARRVCLTRHRVSICEAPIRDTRDHRVLLARDRRGVGVDLHRRSGIARWPHGQVVLAAITVRIRR